MLFLFLVDGKVHFPIFTPRSSSSPAGALHPGFTCVHTTTPLDLLLMLYSSLSLFSLLFSVVSCYNIVDDFSGLTFFDNWDFYGNYDNLTLGVCQRTMFCVDTTDIWP